jgi:hypothetical protein
MKIKAKKLKWVRVEGKEFFIASTYFGLFAVYLSSHTGVWCWQFRETIIGKSFQNSTQAKRGASLWFTERIKLSVEGIKA